MKRFVILPILVILISNSVFAIIPPKDQNTIEAFIYLHKQMKKQETKALEKISTSNLVTQKEVTEKSKDFNSTRTTINTKIDDAMAWVTFAQALFYTSADLVECANEYYEFSKNSYESVKKYPFIALYYTEACSKISDEVKSMKRLFRKVSDEGGFIKASMDERIKVIYAIQAAIVRCRGIISHASWTCRLYMTPGVKTLHLWEVINSETCDKIAKGLINKWG